MTERQTYARYTEAYADWDNSPSYFNASQVLKWALRLGDISDDYQAQVDEAHDIMAGTIG
jgi:hypothetical protein